MTAALPNEYAADVEAVQRIDVVPTILDVVCKLTGLGFAAVARVTEERWVACAVRDQIGFGLLPGGELEIRSTICNEIRQSGELVVIDDVECDALFQTHHTPRQYGFRSYICPRSRARMARPSPHPPATRRQHSPSGCRRCSTSPPVIEGSTSTW